MNDTEQITVRGIYDNGELRFAEPVDLEGCWELQIVFTRKVDEDSIPFESSTHRPEHMQYYPDKLEELHRQIEDSRPHTSPF
ncbi:MAG TPA: hypothetical protein VFR15_19770 [Chloroflexia bacterium]|nr:hypothetical protein [Chloroflexia bacterium]